jgi:lipoprotein-releasing system ATP-binding protein
LGTLESPSEGTIKFDEREVVRVENGKAYHSKTSLNKIRNREIGFVFQFHHLLLEHTAVDNVAMPLLIRGTDESEARREAAEMLELVGLGHRMTHRPGELSGGEQQRVAIARAMVTRPGLILADEPTGNLDPKTAGDVFEMFIRLNQDLGTTLIVVTHSIELSNRFPRSLTVVDGTLEES